MRIVYIYFFETEIKISKVRIIFFGTEIEKIILSREVKGSNKNEVYL